MIIFADCNISPISRVMHQTSQPRRKQEYQSVKGAVSASRLPELGAMNGADSKAVPAKELATKVLCYD